MVSWIVAFDMLFTSQELLKYSENAQKFLEVNNMRNNENHIFFGQSIHRCV